ncbi:Sjogren's syndrome/scleroderma autoantigen 1 family protein [Halovivax gelatinilyticus]|uniref:Sjogren's syndrome/scleroderma autoantigen 1 family protein n=1 Tax=Halovivax gelatinilyticus TaxID=2961597 RepID=UPI0020CA656B|nr:Sjogren's syndrome/scleroderma autoantigen 1 family protein [Halovivax gelatinilyticus]
MSETEDDGGIDKEALREELREKYAADEKKRESTQRMSDLLLKGATMTNAHCGTCGDPLFRQNGTNFCPTCHGGPEGVEASIDVDDESADQATPATPAVDDATDADPTDDRMPAASNGAHTTPETDSIDADGHSFDPDRSPTNPDAARQPTGTPADAARGRTDPVDGAKIPIESELDGAYDSLQTALERWAREAETADNPRHARECLEAAREAADALAALRR